jgi:phosphocarrier protein HPr
MSPAQADGNSPDAGAVPIVREVEIVNKKGLHARASAKFVQTAEQFDADITVGLMMLTAAPGVTITISATGPEAGLAVEALCALIASRFGEDD